MAEGKREGSEGAAAQEPHRAKVYTAPTGGSADWSDHGTGWVRIEQAERAVHVRSEKNGECILYHSLSAAHQLRTHGECIITYAHPPAQLDVALSFECEDSCSSTWHLLMLLQRNLRTEAERSADASTTSAPSPSRPSSFPFSSSSTRSAPPVQRSRLRDILGCLSCDPADVQGKDSVVALLVQEQDYLSCLCSLFEECEHNGETENLGLLFKIFRSLFNLADGTVIESLLEPTLVSDVFGALEHDPDLPSKLKHRQWLQTSVHFKEVVPIRSEETKMKIHQSYRLNYVKDVALARSLDDDAAACLSAMAAYNNAEIAGHLYEDEEYFERLFAQVQSAEVDSDEFTDLATLLQELCSLGKQLSPGNRSMFFTTLLKHGMHEAASKMLSSKQEHAMDKASEVLIDCTFHDSAGLRTFLLKQQEHSLLSQLVELAVDPVFPGLQAQAIEVLMHVMDPATMTTQSVERNGFLETFYESYMIRLVDAIETGAPCSGSLDDGTHGQDNQSQQQQQHHAGEDNEQPKPSDEMLLSLVDFMNFCIKSHGYRVKYFVLRNWVMEKVMRLAYRQEKHLALGAIRFLRNCIGTEDDFFLRYVQRNDLFQWIWRAFKAHGWSSNNMVTSAVLELLRFITARNLQNLVVYTVECFSNELEMLQQEPTVQKLRMRCYQAKEHIAAMDELSRSQGITVSALDEDGKAYAQTQVDQQDHAQQAREQEQHSSRLPVQAQSPQALAAPPQSFAALYERGDDSFSADSVDLSDGTDRTLGERMHAGTVRRRIRDNSMDEVEESYFERDDVDTNGAAESLHRKHELPTSGAERPQTPLRSPHGASTSDDDEADDIVKPRPAKQQRRKQAIRVSHDGLERAKNDDREGEEGALAASA